MFAPPLSLRTLKVIEQRIVCFGLPVHVDGREFTRTVKLLGPLISQLQAYPVQPLHSHQFSHVGFRLFFVVLQLKNCGELEIRYFLACLS